MAILKGILCNCPGKKIVFIFILTLFFFSIEVFLDFTCENEPFARPKKLESADPGNCISCHGKEKVLPKDHVITKNMGLRQCEMCHRPKGYKGKTLAKNIRRNMPLGHIHLLNGIKCLDCHIKGKDYGEVKKERCFLCHEGYKKIIEQTMKIEPNPHSSHYGEIDCDLCHHQHRRSEDYCKQCHDFKYIVP